MIGSLAAGRLAALAVLGMATVVVATGPSRAHPTPPAPTTTTSVSFVLHGPPPVAAAPTTTEAPPPPAPTVNETPPTLQVVPPPSTTVAPEPEPEPTTTTEEEPEPAPSTTEAEAEQVTTTAAVEEPAAPLGGGWAALRQCESGGNYATHTGNGYSGAYQFDQPTWDGTVARMGRADLVGVRPANASPSDQDAAAVQLHAERGSQPWPHCGRYV